MKIQANIYKDNKWWVAQCDALAVYTQGKTKKEAIYMLEDAIQQLCKHYYKKSLKGLVVESKKGETFISSTDINLFFSFILRRVRESLGKSQKDVARWLDCNESNYRRYETGKVSPSLDRVHKLKTLILEKKRVEVWL